MPMSLLGNDPAELEPFYSKGGMQFGLPPLLLKAIHNIETGWDTEFTSEKGNAGPMHLGVDAANDAQKALGIKFNRYDPESVLGGAWYVRQGLDEAIKKHGLGGSEALVGGLRYYNGGPKWQNISTPDGLAENTTYAGKVLSEYKRLGGKAEDLQAALNWKPESDPGKQILSELDQLTGKAPQAAAPAPAGPAPQWQSNIKLPGVEAPQVPAAPPGAPQAPSANSELVVKPPEGKVGPVEPAAAPPTAATPPTSPEAAGFTRQPATDGVERFTAPGALPAAPTMTPEDQLAYSRQWLGNAKNTVMGWLGMDGSPVAVRRAQPLRPLMALSIPPLARGAHRGPERHPDSALQQESQNLLLPPGMGGMPWGTLWALVNPFLRPSGSASWITPIRSSRTRPSGNGLTRSGRPWRVLLGGCRRE